MLKRSKIEDGNGENEMRRTHSRSSMAEEHSPQVSSIESHFRQIRVGESIMSSVAPETTV